MNKRLHYIDNLRWLTVSILILYHAAIAYNTWGEANYIFFRPVKPIAAVVSFASPWFMPVMFLLAGASARFSLQKRGYRTFIKERFLRLGIPFVFGLLVIDPILSYVADVTHNGYSGGYFAHYATYFTRFTDLTGYDGGFTLGHFWFLGVLMIISLVCCVIIKLIGDTRANGRKAFAVGAVLTLGADLSVRLPAGLLLFQSAELYAEHKKVQDTACTSRTCRKYRKYSDIYIHRRTLRAQ